MIDEVAAEEKETYDDEESSAGFHDDGDDAKDAVTAANVGSSDDGDSEGD